LFLREIRIVLNLRTKRNIALLKRAMKMTLKRVRTTPRITQKMTDHELEGLALLKCYIACFIQEVTIPQVWILLDSQSTVDVFFNEKLLTNIRNAKRNLVL